jgi:hypothetical protein
VGEGGEEARVAQLDPTSLAVKLRQGDEEVRHSVLLVPEEVGEAGGEGSALGGVHDPSRSKALKRGSQARRVKAVTAERPGRPQIASSADPSGLHRERLRF